MTQDATINSNSILPSAEVPMTSPKDLATVQIRYAEMCRKDPQIARLSGLLYKWEQDHWKAQSEEDNNTAALQWLARNERSRATAAVAQACTDAAKLIVRTLPAKPKSHVTIIPLQDCWLFVEPDGSIQAIQPDPGVGITHKIACNTAIALGSYVPQPLKPQSLFAQFLASSLPNQDVQDFVQEYIGYTLTGTTKLQVATLWVGAGSNGKSLLLNVVRALHERAVAVRLDKLAGFDLAGILGASLAFCDETPKSKINQQALKSLISGGAVQVEAKYAKPVSYRPTAKFIICANHLPSASDQSDGWWRRLHIVEWNQQIKGKKIIHNLDQQIIDTELDAVLDWALLGLQRLLARGNFAVPDVMQQAKNDAVQSSNTVSAWVQAAGVTLNVSAGQMVEKSVIYDLYRGHCQRHGLMPVSNAEFFKRLRVSFPSAHEDRVTVKVNGVPERVRRLGLAFGNFVKDTDVEECDKVKELNDILLANIDFDDNPFIK